MTFCANLLISKMENGIPQTFFYLGPIYCLEYCTHDCKDAKKKLQ